MLLVHTKSVLYIFGRVLSADTSFGIPESWSRMFQIFFLHWSIPSRMLFVLSKSAPFSVENSLRITLLVISEVINWKFLYYKNFCSLWSILTRMLLVLSKIVFTRKLSWYNSHSNTESLYRKFKKFFLHFGPS